MISCDMSNITAYMANLHLEIQNQLIEFTRDEKHELTDKHKQSTTN